ncbi:mCG147907 [Mus musculus]|nr:mCG147907 [Mus musculus]
MCRSTLWSRGAWRLVCKSMRPRSPGEGGREEEEGERERQHTKVATNFAPG